MCSRDNERNWVAEEARRSLNRSRAIQDREGREWLSRATTAQKRAAKSIELLYKLLAVVAHDGGFMGAGFITDEALHKHFPVFARAAHLRGTFYLSKDGRCPAITFHGLESGFGEDGSWMHCSSASSNRKRDIAECQKLCEDMSIEFDEARLLAGAKAFLNAHRESQKTAPAATT